MVVIVFVVREIMLVVSVEEVVMVVVVMVQDMVRSNQ